MDFLRKLFPIAFGVVPKETPTLVKSIIIHVLVGWVGAAVIGFILGFIGGLLNLGVVFGALGSLIGSVLGLYGTGGVVLSILKFVNVIKN